MAELGPTTIYGDLIGNNDFYVKGSGGLYFNDTNTQITEDSSSNLTFKDATAGTYTLQQLAIRRAYCSEDAPAGNLIQCQLDSVGGTSITVVCQISGQNPSASENLSSCVPRLESGDEIFIFYDGFDWHCITLFQRSQDWDEDLAMAKLKYISGSALTDNTLAAVTDSTNWAINKSIIKAVKVVTDATDWDLTLYCDSDQSSGMFSSLVVANNLSGNQVILLDLPYIDNDGNQSLHVLFVDNVGANGATLDVYGIEARTT